MPLGFCGRVLRVDLTSRRTWVEEVPEATYERWLGGVGLGSAILYREVGPEMAARARSLLDRAIVRGFSALERTGLRREANFAPESS